MTERFHCDQCGDLFRTSEGYTTHNCFPGRRPTPSAPAETSQDEALDIIRRALPYPDQIRNVIKEGDYAVRLDWRGLRLRVAVPSLMVEERENGMLVSSDTACILTSLLKRERDTPTIPANARPEAVKTTTANLEPLRYGAPVPYTESERAFLRALAEREIALAPLFVKALVLLGETAPIGDGSIVMAARQVVEGK